MELSEEYHAVMRRYEERFGERAPMAMMPGSQEAIIDLLRELRRKHDVSYVFISHDLKVVRALCHNVIVMRDGDVVEQGPTDTVMGNPGTEYTKRLVDAALMADERAEAKMDPATA